LINIGSLLKKVLLTPSYNIIKGKYSDADGINFLSKALRVNTTLTQLNLSCMQEKEAD